jgi:DNA polymerase III delta prime subunit
MMDALHSRCQGFEIKPPEREGLEKRAKAILKKEGIEFEEEDVNDIVRNCYPDIRKMINTLQQFSKDGKLKIESGAIVSDAYKTDLINALKEKKSFTDIRQIVINANSMEYDTIYRLLFDSVKEYCEVKSNIGQIMLDISEHLYRDAFVVDKEINLSACILKVLKLLKN